MVISTGEDARTELPEKLGVIRSFFQGELGNALRRINDDAMKAT